MAIELYIFMLPPAWISFSQPSINLSQWVIISVAERCNILCLWFLSFRIAILNYETHSWPIQHLLRVWTVEDRQEHSCECHQLCHSGRHHAAVLYCVLHNTQNRYATVYPFKTTPTHTKKNSFQSDYLIDSLIELKNLQRYSIPVLFSKKKLLVTELFVTKVVAYLYFRTSTRHHHFLCCGFVCYDNDLLRADMLRMVQGT